MLLNAKLYSTKVWQLNFLLKKERKKKYNNRDRFEFGEFHYLYTELRADDNLFRFYTRMTISTFDYIKENGGVIKETINANITDDTITVELQLLDSTLITQHIDFIKEVQIVQVLLLGEEERGQKPYQILCFVNHVRANEFISPDAMAKLRQKNPGTIRVAEDNRGIFNITIDMKIKLKDSAHISKHVSSLCSEAQDTTFTSKIDIDKWAAVPGMYLGNLLQTVEYINYKTPKTNLKLCRNTGKVWSHCLCTMEVSIPWYPCALKFCKDHIGKKAAVESYRCGIQTCAKTMNFMYSVKHKQHCLSIE